mmetsp:Transcript_99240/g.320042  ORF Transcript_99240/g.320042 Transcript_99240/m.320042 type:complete len:276 (-) Transcript_99240:186-1013(-)
MSFPLTSSSDSLPKSSEPSEGSSASWSAAESLAACCRALTAPAAAVKTSRGPHARAPSAGAARPWAASPPGFNAQALCRAVSACPNACCSAPPATFCPPLSRMRQRNAPETSSQRTRASPRSSPSQRRRDWATPSRADTRCCCSVTAGMQSHSSAVSSSSRWYWSAAASLSRVAPGRSLSPVSSAASRRAQESSSQSGSLSSKLGPWHSMYARPPRAWAESRSSVPGPVPQLRAASSGLSSTVAAWPRRHFGPNWQPTSRTRPNSWENSQVPGPK